MRDGRQQVVILYSHPLLGEGMAHLLANEIDADVELVLVDDVERARAALATQPDVVILERPSTMDPTDLLHAAPSALLIDVGLDAGPTWAYRRDELSPKPEDLVQAIRGREVHPAPQAAPQPAAQPAPQPAARARPGPVAAVLRGAGA